MGKIFCIIGKSSSGKDTLYKKLMENETLKLKRIVPYTTRPIREGEQDGVEYNFTTVDYLEKLKSENKIIESRVYDTVHGMWHYFTAKDSNLDIEKYDYITIGTLESYIKTRDYFGQDKVIPIYIGLDDGERLSRALGRERMQKEPKYEEMCRRFIVDAKDFSEENIKQAGINKFFYNDCIDTCINEITIYIKSLL